MRWQRVDTGMSMGLAVSQRGFRAKRLDAGILRLPLGQLSSVEIQASGDRFHPTRITPTPTPKDLLSATP